MHSVFCNMTKTERESEKYYKKYGGILEGSVFHMLCYLFELSFNKRRAVYLGWKNLNTQVENEQRQRKIKDLNWLNRTMIIMMKWHKQEHANYYDEETRT